MTLIGTLGSDIVFFNFHNNIFFHISVYILSYFRISHFSHAVLERCMVCITKVMMQAQEVSTMSMLFYN